MSIFRLDPFFPIMNVITLIYFIHVPCNKSWSLHNQHLTFPASKIFVQLGGIWERMIMVLQSVRESAQQNQGDAPATSRQVGRFDQFGQGNPQATQRGPFKSFEETNVQ